MKGTIGDKVVNFYETFLKVSEKKVSKKEQTLIDPKEYSPVLSKKDYENLTPEKRRNIAMESPLFLKGIKKKNMDTFRAWLKIVADDDKGTVVKADLDTIREFERRSEIKKKCYEAGVCVHIYGDGFLIITFTKDEDKKLSDPVNSEAEPYNVRVVNPEYITDMEEINGVIYYVHNDGADFEKKLIHPDRIIHFKEDTLPFSKFGISKVDILRWTLESKKNVDKASGEILSWFSHGILDLQKEGLQNPERDELLKIAAQHPGSWVHDEETQVDYKNPTAINPQPFYDYIVLNIAAVLNMPTHVLTGIQVGRVTGSEIGFSDYYRDVRDIQELVYQPQLERLYQRIIEARGRVWKYKIAWNPIYVDEGMEVELLNKKVEAAEKALNGVRGAGGFITKQEARKMLNDGQILIDPKDIKGLKENAQIIVSKQSAKTAEKVAQKPPFERQPVQPNKKPALIKKTKLSDIELEMIARCDTANKLRIKKEKELGKKVLNEQSDNDASNKDANERN
jgi:hypothetical protein